MAQWPHERSLVENMAGKPFALVGMHLNYDGDDIPIVKETMIKNQLNWRSFVDRGPIAAIWKPAGTPAYYIIDPGGVIRFKWAGAPGSKAIDTALATLIPKAETDSKRQPK